MRGNKRRALSKTPSKVIINMNIAVEALNKTEIGHLHDIMEKLNVWDDNYRRRFINGSHK